MPENKSLNSVESNADFLSTRIKSCADLYNGRKEAAAAAGVSQDMLSRYMRGDSQPSFVTVAGLCAPVGINLNWVYDGVSPKFIADIESHVQEESGKYDTQEPASINLELLEVCSGVVSELMKEFDYNVPEHKRIRLVGILYEYQRLEDAETGESCRTQAKQLLSLVS